MRKIKFRAWDKRFNMMIYQLANGYRHDFNGDIALMNDRGESIAVSDEFEVMQFAGLKDMDEKEIYEGDILNLNYGIPPKTAHMEIVFKNGAFKVFCLDAEPKEEYLMNVGLESCYVQGNIHENPEILERKK